VSARLFGSPRAMSFALKPSDGSARLLGPSPPKSRSVAEELADRVQAQIQAIQLHSSDIRKTAKSLSATRSASSSAVHWKQVYRVGRDTVAETRRILNEIDPGTSSSSADDRKLQPMLHRKLAENLERAAEALEQSWQDFIAAEAAWTAQRQQEEGVSACAASAELEEGRASGLSIMDDEAIAAAELDMHNAIADEYAQQVARIAQNAHGLQSAMVDLAQHTAAQGEMMEGIDAQMEEAADKTAKATQQVAVTEETQRRSMKWTICLLMVVAALSATVLANVWHD